MELGSRLGRPAAEELPEVAGGELEEQGVLTVKVDTGNLEVTEGVDLILDERARIPAAAAGIGVDQHLGTYEGRTPVGDGAGHIAVAREGNGAEIATCQCVEIRGLVVDVAVLTVDVVA